MGFLDGFNTLFKKRESSVLGIDIGSSAIKVVQLKKKKGKAVLETYGELALGPYANTDIGRATNLSSDQLVGALRDIVREAHTTSKTCGISIPFSSSFITFIKMPALDPKQLAEMVPIEARKYIPVPITEVLLDWWIIPKEETVNEVSPANQPAHSVDTSVEVLVVVIHNEAINKFQGIVAQSELESTFFEIEVFSTIRSILEQGIATQLIFDLGAGSTKLYIVEKGILRSSHTINRGSQDITLAISKALSIPAEEAEKLKRLHGLKGGPEYKDLTEIITLTLDYIFYEANRVMLNYERKNNKNISKVVMTGGGALLKGFDELAKTSLQTEVLMGDPFSKVESPAFLADVLKQAGPEFAVALGLALRKLNEIQ